MQNRQIDRLINQLVKKSAHSKDKALFIRHYDAYSIDAGCVKKIVEDAGFFCQIGRASCRERVSSCV